MTDTHQCPPIMKHGHTIKEVVLWISIYKLDNRVARHCARECCLDGTVEYVILVGQVRAVHVYEEVGDLNVRGGSHRIEVQDGDVRATGVGPPADPR